MTLPPKLLESLQGLQGFDNRAFEKIHASGEQITSIRINPVKKFEPGNLEVGFSPIPWTRYGFYLDERPSFTFDPMFHAGCYYVQEASSMFLEQALRQTVDLAQPLRVLDLSAAPGGKSTHIQSLISAGSLLVSNEVIRSRASVLRDNIIKWGCQNVVVTNNDPKDFAGLENYFDVIVVDAPCSGSGLFRREPDAINEWSENNVALCGQRQQRILADIFPALKKEGILIYATCSYSQQEDEDIGKWLLESFPLDHCSLIIDEQWKITESHPGYRFWPDKVKGEGFFISCFKRIAGDNKPQKKLRSKIEIVGKKETAIVGKWVKLTDNELIRHENTVYAWPTTLVNNIDFILSNLKVIYSGVRTGELIREKFIPDHALAMSTIVNDAVGTIELNYEQGIQYLQRKDFPATIGEKGWHLVTYQGHRLGWVNVLSNRINNYYPKELRILKETKSPP